MTAPIVTFIDAPDWLVPVSVVWILLICIGVLTWLFLRWYIAPSLAHK